MNGAPRYLYLVMMDVEAEQEEEFNRLYDQEHVPMLLRVKGVLSAARYRVSGSGSPMYLAVYEIEAPEVPASAAFHAAVNSGLWPERIRPYTRNRSLMVCSRIYPR